MEGFADLKNSVSEIVALTTKIPDLNIFISPKEYVSIDLNVPDLEDKEDIFLLMPTEELSDIGIHIMNNIYPYTDGSKIIKVKLFNFGKKAFQIYQGDIICDIVSFLGE